MSLFISATSGTVYSTLISIVFDYFYMSTIPSLTPMGVLPHIIFPDFNSYVYQMRLKLLQAFQSYATACIHTYIHTYTYIHPFLYIKIKEIRSDHSRKQRLWNVHWTWHSPSQTRCGRLTKMSCWTLIQFKKYTTF